MITALLLHLSHFPSFGSALPLLAVGTMLYPATIRWAKDMWGHYAVTFGDYTGPASYVTGGEALTASMIKLGVIEFATIGFAHKSDNLTAVVFKYNGVTGKVQAYWGNAGAVSAFPEVDSTTDLSAYTARMMFMGRG